MSWQRYDDPQACEHMSRRLCPECGHSVESHNGWGSHGWCSLTDTGVAGRIWQYEQDGGAVEPAS